MVKIYNFQVASTNVELKEDKDTSLSLSIFDAEATGGSDFEKTLGHALKRINGELLEEKDKEKFKKLFADAYPGLRKSAPKKVPSDFGEMFESYFSEIFKAEYKEVFKKQFAQQFSELFGLDFAVVLAEAIEANFGMSPTRLFRVKFFQVDEAAGLYVKKAIDPSYRVYFAGREAFETYYNKLEDSNEETNYQQKLMRTYQIKMHESELGPLQEMLNLNWIVAEEAQVPYGTSEREHLDHLRTAGINLEEKILLKVGGGLGVENREVDNQSKEIVVAVIDSGIDFSHVNLKDFLQEVEIDGTKGIGYDAYESAVILKEKEEIPEKTHGTGVAGVVEQIFSSTDLDANDVKILYIRAFPDGSDSTMADAIYFASEQGANIINCSWGPLYYRPENILLREAILAAKQQGAVCVFAAGNQGNPVRGYYPANSDDVITVGAVKPNRKCSEFSNYGPELDINASGEHVLSYAPGDQLKLYRGTSFAAPIVSATIALYLYKHGAKGLEDIKKRLLEKSGETIGEDTEALKVDYDSPSPISRKSLNIIKFL